MKKVSMLTLMSLMAMLETAVGVVTTTIKQTVQRGVIFFAYDDFAWSDIELVGTYEITNPESKWLGFTIAMFKISLAPKHKFNAPMEYLQDWIADAELELSDVFELVTPRLNSKGETAKDQTPKEGDAVTLKKGVQLCCENGQPQVRKI